MLYNIYYRMQIVHTILVSFGTPKQTSRILLDTGSDVLNIGSVFCETCDKLFAKPLFNPNQSTTLTNLNKETRINYFDTYFLGYLVNDSVSLMNFHANMNFTVVQEISESYPREFSGIMGLSNDKKYKNLFQLGYQNGDLVSSAFGFQLGIGFLGQPSYFYYNISRKDFPNATYLKLKTKKMWMLNIDKVDIDGIKYQDHDYGAVVDSGTSMLYIPKCFHQQIYLKIFTPFCNTSYNQQAQKNITICNCQNLQNFPEILLYVNNQTLTITPFMYMTVRDEEKICQLLYEVYPGDLFILGMMFMKFYTVIFDKEKNQMGFVSNLRGIYYYVGDKQLLIVLEWMQAVIGGVIVVGLTAIVVSFIQARNSSLRENLSVDNSEQPYPPEVQIQLNLKTFKNNLNPETPPMSLNQSKQLNTT